MDLELDHFFILTDRPQETGDLLVSMGLHESFSRDHPGQGTSNRRFEFANGMLEILYVRDRAECDNGPARAMRFPERVHTENASPFGIIMTRKNDADQCMPFSGWRYQPDYFDPPNAFHVGNNSNILEEPLCIYIPFATRISSNEDAANRRLISNIQIHVPVPESSDTLHALKTVDRLQIELGNEHLMVMTLDHCNLGLSKDFRPDLPLLILW